MPICAHSKTILQEVWPSSCPLALQYRTVVFFILLVFMVLIGKQLLNIGTRFRQGFDFYMQCQGSSRSAMQFGTEGLRYPQPL